MKKRLIIAIAAIGAAAACFGACGKGGNGNNGGFNHYDEINKMFNMDYSKIVVTVTDTIDSSTELVSEYTMTYSGNEITVQYNVERVTGISLDTGNVQTAKYTGTAVIRDGAVISDNGGKLPTVSSVNFNFKADYFTNVNEAVLDIRLDADVKNPSAFMGGQITCSNMHVLANYINSFNNMQITYTAESGNAVKIEYVFTV